MNEAVKRPGLSKEDFPYHTFLAQFMEQRKSNHRSSLPWLKKKKIFFTCYRLDFIIIIINSLANVQKLALSNNGRYFFTLLSLLNSQDNYTRGIAIVALSKLATNSMTTSFPLLFISLMTSTLYLPDFHS